MRKMQSFMKRFFKNEEGLETVEYAIIAGLIVVGLVALVIAIGNWVSAQFTQLKTELGA
ncbi:MAG: Flp family type IVb pilin [Planctomycetota bacterium]